MYKCLIIGGGSMGKRRIRCLAANDVKAGQMRLVDLRADRRDEVLKKHQVAGFERIEDGLAWDPDLVLVSVPGAYHLPACLAALEAGKHVFCEVPLSTSLEGIDRLVPLATGKQLVVAPGCDWAFHPLNQQVKRWLDDPAFGKPLFCHEMQGSYLPDWHPYEDYRSFYGSDRAMGGGNLDMIAQELTLLYWLTGDRMRHVYCQGNKLSELEINASDYHQIVANGKNGLALTMQFDLISRIHKYDIRIVSEQGTIELGSTSARRYLAETGAWDEMTLDEDFDYEPCYVSEIRTLLACVRGETTWPLPLECAIDVVRFLVAIERSDAADAPVEVV
jgi:predicted dehydrogenase